MPKFLKLISFLPHYIIYRHVVMQRISHSNLILVVVDVLCSDNIWTEVRVSYKEVTDVDIFCSKALNPDLTRKRPKPCVGKDVKVEKVRYLKSIKKICLVSSLIINNVGST
ncbi:hypothetical protein ANN_10908 [Periplaneta americana]|uniref:Uncharacterized protein n=1 Tax=Periplaneta americana TaxID=6978 RepID=A0ABQ8T3K3_PERAM|nr:hypothetical protein ANN_10908 [Periplaneta americana]